MLRDLPTLDTPAPEDIREGCPGCGKFSGFNWRKTHQNWRCVHCNSVFDKLIEIPVMSYEQSEAYYKESKLLETEWHEAFWLEMEDTVLTEALNSSFEQHDRYISCIDTVTYCRKCAFMWDKNKKKMCEKCGSWIPNYLTSESCFTCLDKIFGVDHIYEMYEKGII